MTNVREMTAAERYARMASFTNALEGIAMTLVTRELGAQAAADLRSAWEAGVVAMPGAASEEERTRIAFHNWVFKWGTAHDFVRERIGERGVEGLMRSDVEALKHQNSRVAVALLKTIRALAPGTGFRTFGKRMAYEMQAFTPYSVTELSEDRLVCEVPHCEVLDHPGGEPVCLVACQKIYPQWLRDQFGVGMTTNRRGYACTVSLTPG